VGSAAYDETQEHRTKGIWFNEHLVLRCRLVSIGVRTQGSAALSTVVIIRFWYVPVGMVPCLRLNHWLFASCVRGPWSGAPSSASSPFCDGLAATPNSQQCSCSAIAAPCHTITFVGVAMMIVCPTGQKNGPKSASWCLHWIAIQLHGCHVLHGVLGYLFYLCFPALF